MKELIQNKYLLDNYGDVNPNLNYVTQLQNWKWLKRINVIDVEEFKKKETELNIVFKKEGNQIGFNAKTNAL